MLSIVLMVFSLGFWFGAFLIWRRPASDHMALKLLYIPTLLLLYGAGYFCLLVGLGVDHWDDSSAWFWDTWLLFGSAAALAMTFGWARFRGLLRVGLMVLPVLALLEVVWFYYAT